MNQEPMPPPVEVEVQPGDSSEYKHRKQLLLLSMLVVGVTYVAGLNPPGGTSQEEWPGLTAGEPILRTTDHRRYLGFYYCNATALATSLVVIFLLLLKHPNRVQLMFLRLVMVLDMFGLMGAYLVGSCREKPATVYTAALVLSLSAYVGVHILQALSRSQSVRRNEAAEGHDSPEVAAVALRPEERRKVLLLLATFLLALTYVAGLNPPGGFWDTLGDSRETSYRLGDSIFEAHHRGHFRMFFYSNATAFVASLFIIVFLLVKNSSSNTSPSFELQVFILSALLGLLAAYTAGSCRSTDCSVYVVSLFGAVLIFIFLAMLIIICVKRLSHNPQNHSLVQDNNDSVVDAQSNPWIPTTNGQASNNFAHQVNNQQAKKVKSLVLLLANLVATITYHAGLNPPGGFWPNDHDGHKAGDSILMRTSPVRYKVFFYCNSTSFVASLVSILMVQNMKLVKGRTLLVAMMLDMLALVGAYAAGSCRDVQTSIHVVGLAGAILVYLVLHIVFSTLGSVDMEDRQLEKKHKRLLLLAILVATITYQVGLNPPGGFWIKDGKNLMHHAGDVVLLNSYPRRYRAFFYCNTVSFMASIAIILLLVNPNLWRLAIQCYALYICQVAGLCGILGAFAAGSARSVRTSIYVFVLVAVVIAFIVVHIIVFDFWKNRRESNEAVAPAVPEEPPRGADEAEYRDQEYGKRKYLMLLGILAASVTYDAGLAPPGGVWQDDDDRFQREAGNSVLHDVDPHRFRFFFYSNSTSFVASVVIMALLLEQILRKHRYEDQKLLLLASNSAVILDILGLLMAYAVGSTREWSNFFMLSVLVVLLMAVHLGIWMFGERRRRSGGANRTNNWMPPIEQVENGQEV